MPEPPATGIQLAPVAKAEPAAVTGAVRWILRGEAAITLILCCVFYELTGFGWGPFALLFLVPDLALLFYLVGPKAGAAAYNLMHTTTIPILLGMAGFFLGLGPLPPVALIWAAHISFDRLLGLGLKYPQGFGYTHLGRIGAAARQALGKS